MQSHTASGRPINPFRDVGEKDDVHDREPRARRCHRTVATILVTKFLHELAECIGNL